MKNEQIIEGNKLLAEFMGWYIDISISENYPNQEWHYSKRKDAKEWDSGRCVELDSPDVEQQRQKIDTYLWNSLLNSNYSRCGSYHKDWTKLMSIRDKIQSLDSYEVLIGYKFCKITRPTNVIRKSETVIKSLGNSDIETVWKACVEFVKYYNKTMNNKS